MTKEIAVGAFSLCHHVDALEVSCDLRQVELLLTPPESPEVAQPKHESSGTPSACDLELKLDRFKRRGPVYSNRATVETDWLWQSAKEPEPVRLLAKPRRSGYAYALETEAWIIFVAYRDSPLPRFTVQLRADYLLTAGPLDAYIETVCWVSENLLPLVNGLPEDVLPRWTISRIDLAADVAGVKLEAADLSRFVTRARNRQGHHSVENHRFSKFTGLVLGRRGGTVMARIYDKTEEADENALIRDVWMDEGYDAAVHGEQVWRVEFEIRRSLLSELRRADGSCFADGSVRFLAEDLDATWRYLVTDWLKLKEWGGATRIERKKLEPWWAGLGNLEGLSSHDRCERPKRAAVKEKDPSVFLARSLRELATASALNGEPSLVEALRMLTGFARQDGGQARYCERVAAAEARRDPQRSTTTAAIRSRAAELERQTGGPAWSRSLLLVGNRQPVRSRAVIPGFAAGGVRIRKNLFQGHLPLSDQA